MIDVKTKFVEVKAEKPFDWNKFLKNASRRKTPLSEEEHIQVSKRSQSWVTCACGNQCAIIPRWSYDDTNMPHWAELNSPKDKKLNTWGIQFFRAVDAQKWKKAKEILNKIEGRSIVLIRQIVLDSMKDSIKTLNAYGFKVVPK